MTFLEKSIINVNSKLEEEKKADQSQIKHLERNVESLALQLHQIRNSRFWKTRNLIAPLIGKKKF